MAHKPKKFIQKAIENPGSLTATAKAQGKTPAELCSQGNLSPLTQKRCNLRKTLMGFHNK